MSDSRPIKQTGRFNKYYKIIGPELGTGGFGTVYMVSYRHFPSKRFAVKVSKKTFDKDTCLNQLEMEIKHWATIDSDYFVRYRSSWIETATNANTTIRSLLPACISPSSERHLYRQYIEMDWCWFTLFDVIRKMSDHFKRDTRKLWPLLGYIMAAELFDEILQALNYLHTCAAVLIHRDIKPRNILIRQKSSGTPFVKIGDFGLVVTAQPSDNSSTSAQLGIAGTPGYMAPEVLLGGGGGYTTKSDVYSLAVMAIEMFNMNLATYKS
ncbi:interferon-induced, double-stranded RNA-activated protein kinase-like [Oppia nitens]|uniref:interferon-induced, double-stranded RNA-activated protein kinase-like n=1 Tax=Oppia nitens TaxID=1686743 RepID=UPI0023DAE1FF|nr:interferon-induced, double-stranded RNA-activated protein kinase-like [Oppia nitens]